MRSITTITVIFFTSLILSCVSVKEAQKKNQLEPQHKIVYGQYSPPDLELKDFQKIFGNKKISSLEKISGGFSGAKLYQVEVENHLYIVRSTGGLFGKAGIKQEVTLMEQASDAGIAPKINYADRINGVVSMEKITNIFPNHFVPGFLKSWPDFLNKVASGIRKIHNLKPDASIVTNRYFDVYFYDLVKHVDKNLLSPSDLYILEKFSNKKWPRGKKVLSHNDLHSRNLLYNGNSLYIIDWEMAGFGPEFYDLAIFANMQAMTNDEGKEFLNIYLERQASRAEYQDFVAMRQLQALTHAIFNLLAAKRAPNDKLKILYEKSPPLTVRNFLLALDSNLLDVKNPNHLYENGLVLLRYAEYFK